MMKLLTVLKEKLLQFYCILCDPHNCYLHTYQFLTTLHNKQLKLPDILVVVIVSNLRNLFPLKVYTTYIDALTLTGASSWH